MGKELRIQGKGRKLEQLARVSQKQVLNSDAYFYLGSMTGNLLWESQPSSSERDLTDLSRLRKEKSGGNRDCWRRRKQKVTTQAGDRWLQLMGRSFKRSDNVPQPERKSQITETLENGWGKSICSVRILLSRKGGQETMTTVCDLNDQDLEKDLISFNLERWSWALQWKKTWKLTKWGGLQTNTLGIWRNRQTL